MFCPKCGKTFSIISQARPTEITIKYNLLVRYRKCKVCGYKSATCEMIIDNRPTDKQIEQCKKELREMFSNELMLELDD